MSMYQELDKYLEESKAGLPDEVIAERSGWSVDSVAKWRRQRGVKKPRGLGGGAEGQRYALQLLGSPMTSRHTTGNLFAGNWKIPEYLLRQPLNYTAFCRLVHSSRLSDSELSEAIGVRDSDITAARATWKRYLSQKGHVCKTCNQLVDPKHSC